MLSRGKTSSSREKYSACWRLGQLPPRPRLASPRLALASPRLARTHWHTALTAGPGPGWLAVAAFTVIESAMKKEHFNSGTKRKRGKGI